MGLLHGFSWVVGMNGEVYRAIGKPAYETIVTATTLVIYLIAYVISIRRGFEVFVWVRFALAMGALFLHLFVLKKVLSISIIPIVQYLLVKSIIIAVVVLTVRFLVNLYFVNALSQLFVGGLLDIIIIGIVIFLFERNGILIELFELIKKRDI
jgi:hypothetical protein